MMWDENIEILLVEDNPGDVHLFREAMREGYDSKFELTHCPTLALALERLAEAEPDVIVLDLGLPDALGLEVVRMARAAAPSVPLVVLTSRDDETLGVQALHDGAQDYLTKADLNGRLLVRALRYAMERQRMKTVLENESLIDALTGLYNRRGFNTLVDNHLKQVERTRKPFALVFLDLDGMKRINDELGHAQGDRALVETASLLRGLVRQSDVLARLGGDEFVLLLGALDGDADATIRRRLNQRLDLVNAQSERKYTLSISIGIVIANPETPLVRDELLARADKLMYLEKQRKRQLTHPAASSSESS
jgi:two-component system cell cycle response regulator